MSKQNTQISNNTLTTSTADEKRPITSEVTTAGAQVQTSREAVKPTVVVSESPSRVKKPRLSPNTQAEQLAGQRALSKYST